MFDTNLTLNRLVGWLPETGNRNQGMKVAIYVRVSTADQNQELQLRELQDYAARHQWEVGQIYQDIISGSSASKPGLNLLMDDARARKLA